MQTNNSPKAPQWSHKRQPSTQPSSGRKRFAVLLAALAVPAMAAPGDFGALPGDAAREGEAVNARLAAQIAENPPMLFERPGMSFPGSAYFFLDDPGDEALIALPNRDASASGAESGRELGALIDAGPGAAPFFSSSSGTSHLRARECLAQAIWYEAASESEAGQRAVAQVVLNRVTHPSWPGSVCGVVYQGSHRDTGCQFSFTCDGSLARRPGGASWRRAERLAGEALSGSTYAAIGHATHYHTLWVSPSWAASLDHIGTIGAHRFYRNRGVGGESSAFTDTYAGYEPAPSVAVGSGVSAPTARVGRPNNGAIRIAPVPVATSDIDTPSTTPVTAPTAPAPILANPQEHIGAGRVREDYARAGQWKSDAARAALQSEERALAEDAAAEGASNQPHD